MDAKANGLVIIDHYCDYCQKVTKHELSGAYNKDGTGCDRKCLECGSTTLHKIQGFNSNLM
jgi:hypothetical protein